MKTEYERILVAIDGSHEAESAFKRSIEIAKWNNGILNLIYVVDTSSYIAMTQHLPDSIDDFHEYGKRLLDNYKKKSIAAGLTEVNIFVSPGSPKRVITHEFARSLEADLIVCGAQGLHAVEHFFMGSVSENIVRNSPCDVLIVRMHKSDLA